MSASVNSLTILLNRQDSSGTNVENRSVGAISYSADSGEFDIRKAPDTSQHTLDLPSTTVVNVYIKNTHASAILTLVGTISGGSTMTIAKLGPGEVFIKWGVATTYGYTDLKYTMDTTGGTFEMFLGGA